MAFTVSALCGQASAVTLGVNARNDVPGPVEVGVDLRNSSNFTIFSDSLTEKREQGGPDERNYEKRGPGRRPDKRFRRSFADR